MSSVLSYNPFINISLSFIFLHVTISKQTKKIKNPLYPDLMLRSDAFKPYLYPHAGIFQN